MEEGGSPGLLEVVEAVEDMERESLPELLLRTHTFCQSGRREGREREGESHFERRVHSEFESIWLGNYSRIEIGGREKQSSDVWEVRVKRVASNQPVLRGD